MTKTKSSTQSKTKSRSKTISKNATSTTVRNSSKRSSKNIASIKSIGTYSRKTDMSKFSETTWVVFRGPSGEKKPLLFNEKLSRDEVRSAYARITGTDHVKTRSRRLKNY